MTAFRDPGGKFSMTRILALGLFVDATALVPVVAYAIINLHPSAGVVAAYASVVTAFVGSGCVAIANRTKGFAPTLPDTTGPAYVDTRTEEERQADAEGC